MLSDPKLNNALYDSFFLDQTFNSPIMITHSKNEISWLVEKLDLKSDMSIIDVACGSGRHLKAFCELGFSPTGLDISPDCVMKAKENCPSINNQIFQTSLLELSSYTSKTFNLVFIAGCSFRYDSSLSVILEHLKALIQLVSSEGTLVIQYLSFTWAKKSFKDQVTFWNERDDMFILDRRKLDDRLLTSEKIFIKKRQSFQKRYSDIVYTLTNDEVLNYVNELCNETNMKFEKVLLADSFSDKEYNEQTSTSPVLVLKRTK